MSAALAGSGDYAAFLASKAPRAQATGMVPLAMPDHMFDYQKACTEFCLKQGRAAIFLDTGLGKTRIELEFCHQATIETGFPALVLAPLAVAGQIARQGAELGYPIRVVRDQSEVSAGINVCNYDRLDKLDPTEFGCVALDESSILKSLHGVMRKSLTEAFQDTPFRLCATATPAPNDHMELGQHAEFLGVLSSMEMLARWFVNDTSTGSQVWRLKGHAANAFLDWMATWSRCAETPADLGYDATRFILPELKTIRHKVAGDTRAAVGMLFAADLSATNMFAAKRETAEARAEALASLIAAEPNEPWVVWCDTNDEQDAVVRLVPGIIDVRGSMTPDQKEANLERFISEPGAKIVTKAKIAGYGLNWQHAARVVFIGRSFSYESWYQAVRRCWRFGQTRPVHVHIMVAEGEDQIGRVIDRKSAGHIDMKRAMALSMKRAMVASSKSKMDYNPTHIGTLPRWF